MTRDALLKALDYIEDQGTPVQITYDGRNEYTLDFKHMFHANACYEELSVDGYMVTLNPTGYYARIA